MPFAALLAAPLLGAAPALAEPPKQADPVAAEALFKDARALLEKGDWAAACPKFAASFALYPSASIMLNIARCHEHDGNIATAWQDYHQAMVLNRETKGALRQRELADIATKGASALEPRLPKLRIVIASAPAGLRVMRDGKEIPTTVLGEPLPVDPGQHEVSAAAPGYRPETRSVTLEEGKAATVEITLEAERAGASAPDAPRGSVPSWAWATGAGGLALTGASVFFLVDDLSAISALRANCRSVQGGTYCAPGYDFQHDNARKNRSFPLFVGLGSAGVIAIGAAVVGIVRRTPPKRQAPAAGATAIAAPWVTPGGTGAALSGRF